jgi:perosamine synthetase
MLPLSTRIATTAEPAHIIQRRRQNYLALDQALTGVPGYRKLFAGLPEGVCPLYLPIWVDRREQLMSAMYRPGVETFRFGATPHPIIGDALRADSRRLRENILGLPIHDQVSESDIARMAEILRALL